MKRLGSQQIAVAQGEVALFSDFEDEGEMWTGEGARERRQTVQFDEPFLSQPAVHVGLSLYDIASAANIRADVRAENITRNSFDAVFRTWGDTRVARVRMNWLAIGAVPHEGDWDLGS